MSDKPIVIILKDSVAKSIAKSLATFAMLWATIGFGVWAESSAMQWAGFILSALVIMGLVQRLHNDNRLTIAQARAKLDEIEKGGA